MSYDGQRVNLTLIDIMKLSINNYEMIIFVNNYEIFIFVLPPFRLLHRSIVLL